MGDAEASRDDWGQLTALLNRMSGSRDVQRRVFDLVYGELRRIARRLVNREAGDKGYRATELLHDTYLKKLRGMRVPIRDRQHFYSLATRAMRQVLIEEARRRQADKRSLPVHLDFDSPVGRVLDGNPQSLLRLEPLLSRLRKIDPGAATVVDLRFMLGCSLEETADVLGVSLRRVRDDWDFARLWLRERLETA
jgi:RNA polymerase sigma factor (TIGR02999 family)